MNENRNETNRSMLLMQSFWELQKSIMGQVKETATANDLSVPQFSILMLMLHRSQVAQKKLQAQTHYPKSTLSHAIEGLVQAGFLIRKHVEGNRREMDLELSEEGKVFIHGMMQQENGVHKRFKDAVDSFTEEEFSELLNAHQQIIAYFEGGGTN